MKKMLFVAVASLFATAAFAQNVTTGHVNTTELIQLMPAMDTVRTRLDEAQRNSRASSPLISRSRLHGLLQSRLQKRRNFRISRHAFRSSSSPSDRSFSRCSRAFRLRFIRR